MRDASTVVIRKAILADVAVVTLIREQAAAWLAAVGHPEPPGDSVDAAWIAKRITAGTFHLVEADGEAVAIFRLEWADSDLWPDDGTAGYLFSLGVAARAHRRGFGLAAIDGAIALCRAAGRSALRLDCLGGNPRLDRYYREAGFTHVETRDLPEWTGTEWLVVPASLYERGFGQTEAAELPTG